MPGGFDAFTAAVRSHVNTWWPAAGTYVKRGVATAPPRVLEPNADWVPEPGEPYVVLEFIWSTREQFGAIPSRKWQARGIFQFEIHETWGAREGPVTELADRVATMWDVALISGLHTYETMPPARLPGPSTGWYPVRVDTSFLWLHEE